MSRSLSPAAQPAIPNYNGAGQEVPLWEPADVDHFEALRARRSGPSSSPEQLAGRSRRGSGADDATGSGKMQSHSQQRDPEQADYGDEEQSRWEATQLTGAPRGKEPVPSIDVRGGRFPCCVVWTALPGLTFLFPFIGHMGIGDSRGVVYDFAGPYHIGVDDLAFGACLRYLPLDPAKMTRRAHGQSPAQAWDAAVDRGNDEYCGRMHNICCDNCHSHVARVLNEGGYGGRSDWNMVSLAILILLKGRWTSTSAALCTWGPWLVILILVLALRYGLK